MDSCFFWLPQGCWVLLTLKLNLYHFLQRETSKSTSQLWFGWKKSNKMVGDHGKQMGWHLTIPKKWTVPSLPNTSWEGVLGMFLGSKHVSKAFRGFVWLWVLGSVYNLVGGFNPSEKYWSNWIKIFETSKWITHRIHGTGISTYMTMNGWCWW